MAIEFDCPNCKTHYRLKDEFGGKTATCKNPNCRKIIPIPKPTGAVLATTPADLDALAAAAFADEPAKADKAEEMIQVTCAGCDHVWQVEAAKEGKNVLCPECRRPTRVPMRKKEEKADWRTGGGGPSMAKRDTGMDREGAFATATAGGISQQTAAEIVKGRVEEEEPEERRKRLIKRAVALVLVLGVVGAGVFFLLRARTEMKIDANMADAVKEQKESGVRVAGHIPDPRFEAVIFRASAEQRARTAGSASDANEALADLKRSRNLAKPAPNAEGTDPDRLAVLADIAATFPQLVARGDQGANAHLLTRPQIATDLRQALTSITDAELAADVIRRVTREAARRDQPTLAEDYVFQPNVPNGNELAAQIGLELLRMAQEPNGEKYRADAEAILKKLASADTPGVHAMRIVLNKPAQPKKEGEPAPSPPLAAMAEADAIRGNLAGAKAARNVPKPEDRAKALAAVGRTLADTNPTEAGPFLVDASKQLKELKGAVSPWVAIRVCELLARLGQVDEAESLAASLADEATRAWARVAILRGRLEAAPDKKGDDGWLEPIGDPSKVVAAAKAREVIARHNAAAGVGDYQAVVKKWPIGVARPFGMAGLVLGQLDRRDGK
jgi:hypothetical protein